MPRKARITVAGAVHHVMSRGIEGNSIFRTDEDRWFLKNLLEKNLRKSGYILYAWSFMPNHYHLVLRINTYPLGAFMRIVNGRYAQYFRKNEEKQGYLFQGRYKSIVSQDQMYIEELIRYVHLNPIRGGICKDVASLALYPWCGHAVLMGKAVWAFQNQRDILRRYGKDKKSARKNYEAFLRAGLEKEPGINSVLRDSANQTESIHNTSCWVIGNKDFVQQALANEYAERIRISKYARQGITVDKIARKVCSKLNVQHLDIKKKSRGNARSDARKIIAYLANRHFQIPLISVARYFNISSPSASKMVNLGEKLMDDLGLSY
ncbi:MAG: hypothetical protein GF350_07890 [Chitinivibrionales bacterium]|nr:hypothetical protein [Chitinivibrionales bacterium]